MKTSIRATVMRMEERKPDVSEGWLIGLSGSMCGGKGRSSVKEDTRFLAWVTVTKEGNERRSRQLKEHVFCPR